MRKLATISLIAIFSIAISSPSHGQEAILRFPRAARGARVSHNIACYRCGESLVALSLPLSRRDRCPKCSADVHVCRMCRHFDPRVPRQCREDGADDVTEKERPNFCDWFVPSDDAFDADRKSEADAAKNALDALFGGSGED